MSVDLTSLLRYCTLTANRVGVVYFRTRKEQYLHFQMQTIPVICVSYLKYRLIDIFCIILNQLYTFTGRNHQ